VTTPWWWRARVRRLQRNLPARSAAAATGDLLEEYDTRRERNGRWRAERWLRSEMASLTSAYRAEGVLGVSRRWRLPHLGGSVTHAVRSLRRSPWYVVTVVSVIAASFALDTAVFAIVDGTLFKPLPYRDSDRLFGLSMGYSKLAEPMRSLGGISAADVAEVQTAIPGIPITAFNNGATASVGVNDVVQAAQIDEHFFDVVGQWPLIGGLTREDFGSADTMRPAAISYGLWQRKFGGSPAALGQRLVDDTGTGIRVAAVLPKDFLFPFPSGRRWTPDVLMPRVQKLPLNRTASLEALVRVPVTTTAVATAQALREWQARSVSVRPAPAAVAGLSARQQVTRAGYDRIALEPVDTALTGDVRPIAWSFFAAAAALVLLACLNVAGLTIGRVRDQWRALVTRRALGARAVDLVALLAIEQSLVVLAGAAIGLAGARLLLTNTLRLMGGFMVVIKPPAIDTRVFIYAAVAAVSVVVLVTMIASRAVTRASLRQVAADGGGTTTRERGFLWITSAELAAGFVLTVGGALVAGSLLRAWQEDTGFDSRNVALVSVSPTRSSSSADIEMLVAHLARLPGVTAAGGINHPFFENGFNGSEFDRPPGVPLKGFDGTSFPIESVPVTWGFFDAMDLRPIHGRLPTAAEFLSGASVVVVTDTVAGWYWPGRTAVGQTLVRKGRVFDVVGVVPDIKLLSLDSEAQGEIYVSLAAAERKALGNVLIRFEHADSQSIAPVVAAIVRDCPGCWLHSAEMLDTALGMSIKPRQFNAWLFSGFALAALVIVSSGILGLVAMTTSRRTREIGIRMALGATPQAVVGQIVREQFVPVALGLTAGGLVAAWATQFVKAYLYKTPVYDPWSWATAVTVLIAIAIAAALIPSSRASRIDPVQALRVD
jgi:predicted permease